MTTGTAGNAGSRRGKVPHHFSSRQQHHETSRLGMWLFLATELLIFGGLFCFYGVYRARHPEIFVYAHQYLDKTLGGINTVILICSSFTMAWAVRSAQTGARRALVLLLAATLLLATGFLGVKYVEYRAKWQHGLLPGKAFAPRADAAQDEHHPADAAPATVTAADAAAQGGHAGPVERPDNVHIFFGIYFTMTGLHLVHVIGGMIAIGWLLARAKRGDFTPETFLPVDMVGLYWHLVDLIWIYLFPLLYLID